MPALTRVQPSSHTVLPNLDHVSGVLEQCPPPQFLMLLHQQAPTNASSPTLFRPLSCACTCTGSTDTYILHINKILRKSMKICFFLDRSNVEIE
jgi:hypothetical protein